MMFNRALVGVAVVLIACSDQRSDFHGRFDSTATSIRVPAPAEVITDSGPLPLSDNPTLFDSLLGDSPEMAWLVPPQTLLATARRSRLYLIVADTVMLQASFVRALTTEQHRDLMREHHVACEMTEGVVLFEYRMPVQVNVQRVLVTGRAIPGPVRAGMRDIALTAAQLAEADSLIGDSGLDRKDIAYAVSAGRASWAIHARFGPGGETGEVVGTALVLRDAAGRLIAADVRGSDHWNNVCDGCEIPTGDTDLAALYNIRMVFEVPGFPWPLLLIDTSTNEGRALSLVTVNSAGILVEYRRYEYVVNC